MKRTMTLNTFRRVEVAEEAMIRATMPRTSAADQTPLYSDIRTETPHRTWRAGSLITKTSFTLAEVARA